MPRKLFCEISPLTYRISTAKGITVRRLRDAFSGQRFASEKVDKPLSAVVYTHQSLIRRKLGEVNAALQENKAVNLGIAAPKISGILIRPGQTFSFWRLVGSCTPAKGYREGLTIASGAVGSGVGGGMCQFTNLLHWLVLHSPLTITEHHHHNGFDLFPDFGRQIPFGTGTSIFYNYKDYRFRNDTDHTFAIFVEVRGDYLLGSLTTDKPLDCAYHVFEEEAWFERRQDGLHRHNKVLRRCVDKKSGNRIFTELLLENDAKVLYDEKYIEPSRMKEAQTAHL